MTSHYRQMVLEELADRYTALPENYRHYVREADEATLRHVLQLALSDAPGSDISSALGIAKE